ncbi:MAG TPA: hypothetical protein VNA25_30310 [Phycisphaerae bacterium]|nr:hypothetical protein [Phycisphaerae bacterium]
MKEFEQTVQIASEKIGQEFEQRYPATWLDDYDCLRWNHIEPNAFLASVRATGDREAARRGLMFIGEARVGDEISRYYVRPTFWRRLRFFFVPPRLEKRLAEGR